MYCTPSSTKKDAEQSTIDCNWGTPCSPINVDKSTRLLQHESTHTLLDEQQQMNVRKGDLLFEFKNFGKC